MLSQIEMIRTNSAEKTLIKDINIQIAQTTEQVLSINRLKAKGLIEPVSYIEESNRLDKKLYPELQRQYCANPTSGACPCYNVGDEFVFYHDGEKDDFWHMGLNTLVKTNADPDTVAGGSKRKR